MTNYNRGIRCSQIVAFLSAYAHPLVTSREAVVPSNVCDQLLLWEAEQHRMRAQEAQLVAFGDMPGMVGPHSYSLTLHPQALILLVYRRTLPEPCPNPTCAQTDATYRALRDYSTRHLGAGVLFVSDADMLVAYSPSAFEQMYSYYADNYC